MLLTEATWALCSLNEVLLQRKISILVTFIKTLLDLQNNLGKCTITFCQRTASWNLNGKENNPRILEIVCPSLLMQVPIPFLISARTLPKNRKKQSLSFSKLFFYLQDPYSRVKEDTSSPASSYKDSSSVACNMWTILFRDHHSKKQRYKKSIDYFRMEPYTNTCNKRKAQYWLTAGPSSLAMT